VGYSICWVGVLAGTPLTSLDVSSDFRQWEADSVGSATFIAISRE